MNHDGHTPHASPGMWSASKTKRPLLYVAVLSSRTLILPLAPLATLLVESAPNLTYELVCEIIPALCAADWLW
jgi:hypothetical protein